MSEWWRAAQALWRSGTSAFGRLSSRERTLILLAGVLTAGLLTYVVAVRPLQNTRVRLVRASDAKRKELQELRELRQRCLRLRQEIAAAEARLDAGGSDFSLFAHLDRVAAETVGREKVASMNPATKTLGSRYEQTEVNVRLAGVSLRELVSFLYAATRDSKGAPVPVRIAKLQLRRQYADPYRFDTTLVVTTTHARRDA